MFDYDPKLIQDCSNRLKFETVNIFLSSKELDPEQLDKVRQFLHTI
jgi:phenylalanyl-tRNA synthetase beta subunit